MKCFRHIAILGALLLATRLLAEVTTPPSAADAHFSRYAKYLVIVEGNAGQGSASVIKFRGNPLVVTNAHVVSGNDKMSFRLLDSRKLTTGRLGIAKESDIAVATQNELKDGFEFLENVESTASIGDDVIVLGNSLGSEVITEIPGKIVGIGPRLVEVDAKFVQGNSGSPILHVKSGKVIGIASFALFARADPLTKDSKFSRVRRFGYRLDTATKWEYPSWEKFRAEAKSMQAVIRSLEPLLIMMADIGDDGILDPKHYNQAGERTQRRVLDFVTTMRRPGAQRFYREHKLGFIRMIDAELAHDMQQVKPETFTRFHGRMLEDIQQLRQRLRAACHGLQRAQQATNRFELPDQD